MQLPMGLVGACVALGLVIVDCTGKQRQAASRQAGRGSCKHSILLLPLALCVALYRANREASTTCTVWTQPTSAVFFIGDFIQDYRKLLAHCCCIVGG